EEGLTVPAARRTVTLRSGAVPTVRRPGLAAVRALAAAHARTPRLRGDRRARLGAVPSALAGERLGHVRSARCHGLGPVPRARDHPGRVVAVHSLYMWAKSV